MSKDELDIWAEIAHTMTKVYWIYLQAHWTKERRVK
jgi:hypothetical protein